VKSTKFPVFFALVACFLATVAFTAEAKAEAKKPNIVVIWGDDTGRTNISAYAHGIVGYRTPNIDQIAREGVMFIDYYTENSCTAGRAAFIQGQSVFRTGNSKVGLPGAKQGIDARDPTIAELLKPLGYATAQYGKNHLGDRNEYLVGRSNEAHVLSLPRPRLCQAVSCDVQGVPAAPPGRGPDHEQRYRSHQGGQWQVANHRPEPALREERRFMSRLTTFALMIPPRR
jgi:arylsulfatase A-like enzyme